MNDTLLKHDGLNKANPHHGYHGYFSSADDTSDPGFTPHGGKFFGSVSHDKGIPGHVYKFLGGKKYRVFDESGKKIGSIKPNKKGGFSSKHAELGHMSDKHKSVENAAAYISIRHKFLIDYKAAQEKQKPQKLPKTKKELSKAIMPSIIKHGDHDQSTHGHRGVSGGAVNSKSQYDPNVENAKTQLVERVKQAKFNAIADKLKNGWTKGEVFDSFEETDPKAVNELKAIIDSAEKETKKIGNETSETVRIAKRAIEMYGMTYHSVATRFGVNVADEIFKHGDGDQPPHGNRGDEVGSGGNGFTNSSSGSSSERPKVDAKKVVNEIKEEFKMRGFKPGKVKENWMKANEKGKVKFLGQLLEMRGTVYDHAETLTSHYYKESGGEFKDGAFTDDAKWIQAQDKALKQIASDVDSHFGKK